MHTINFFLSTPDLMFSGAFASFLLAWCPLSSGLGFGVGGSGCLGTGGDWGAVFVPTALAGERSPSTAVPCGSSRRHAGQGDVPCE